MGLIESLTINLGAALLKATAKIWLKDWTLAEGAAGGLVDTLKKRIEDFETRRAAEQLFSRLQDDVAQRLKPLIDAEFPNLPDNERNAAVLAVGDIFQSLDLSRALATTDLDATKLEELARRDADVHVRDLSPDGRALAGILLRESSNYAITISGKLPSFDVAVSKELLKRNTELHGELKLVLDALAAMRTTASRAEGGAARDFELQYRRTLARRLDRLELFGVRLVNGGARDYPLTVAYVSITATGRGDKIPVRVEHALAGARRIAIRGEAGSGKTTLLQWLAVRAANRDFAGPLVTWNDRVPFYLALRNYTVRALPRPEQFLDAVVPNLVAEMPAGWVHQQLRVKALLLLDGVDELPAVRRRDFTEWLRDVVDTFPELAIILTSRPAAFDAEVGPGLGATVAQLEFDTSELQPMNLADSEALVMQWHAAVARDTPRGDEVERLEAYERDLRQLLRDRPAIRNLASSPLLCAMICALNWDRRRRVPDQRMELYRAALEMLLDARDADRGIRATHVEGLEFEVKQELLGTVSYWMLRNGLKEADRESVERQVATVRGRYAKISASDKAIVQELLERSGVLTEPQHGVLGWIHRTFLEYMAAKAAVASDDIRVLADQAKEESWRETIVFAAGHAQGKWRDSLVRELVKRRWVLTRPVEAEVTAACCLETVGSSLDPKLLKELREMARRLFPPKDVGLAQVLAPAAANDPTLLSGHAAAGPSAVAGCIRTAAIVGGPRMLEVIESYAAVDGLPVDVEILKAWQSFSDDDFFGRVISRRSRILGLTPQEMGEEEIRCLQILLETGDLRPPFADARVLLGEFTSEGVLDVSGRTKWLPTIDARMAEATEIVRLLDTGQGREPFRALSAGTIRLVASLKSLKHLRVGMVDAQALPMLAALDALETLECAAAWEVAVDWVRQLPKLRLLLIQAPRFADLQVLGECAALEWLHVRSAELSLSDFDNNRVLRELVLDECSLMPMGGSSSLSGLRKLSLRRLQSGVLAGLAALPELRKLELVSPPPWCKVEFDKLLRLEEFSCAGGGYDTIRNLALATALRKVEVGGIDMERLALRPPPRLQELGLGAREVDVSYLAEAKGLRVLRIAAGRVWHAPTLLHLQKLESVSMIGLEESHQQEAVGVLARLRERGVATEVIVGKPNGPGEGSVSPSAARP